MKKNGFTLIELLAVIVILAIIALIATPIILNIIRDARESANERSKELYATAVKTAIMKKKIEDPKAEIKGSFTQTNAGRTLTSASGDVVLTVEYDGDVQCDVIEVLDNYELKLDGCKVEGVDSNYNGTVTTPSTPSLPGVGGSDNPTGGYDPDINYFGGHSWETIVSNVRNGNTDMYKVGDTKTIGISYPFGSLTPEDTRYYTVRIANKSNSDWICKNDENYFGEPFSKTACGFVIEFVDIIDIAPMNSTDTVEGGWSESWLRSFLNGGILNALPYDLRAGIIDTFVVSGSNDNNNSYNTSTDKLYLLSPYEIWYTTNYDYFIENDAAGFLTRQLDYYSQFEVIATDVNVTSDKTIKEYNGSYTSWWLRSIPQGYGCFFLVNKENGLWGRDGASYAYGVAPAFRIG